MALTATVFGPTLAGENCARGSIMLRNLVDCLVNTHLWTVIDGAYYDDSDATMKLFNDIEDGDGNMWSDEAHIKFKAAATTWRLWIVLRNSENMYVTIYINKHVLTGHFGFLIALSKVRPTGGSVGTGLVDGYPPTSVDMIWVSDYNTPETPWIYTFWGPRINTNTDFRTVVWADDKSFFMCAVTVGQKQAGGYIWCFRLSKSDANDPYPYLIGSSNTDFALPESNLNPHLIQTICRGRMAYPVDLGSSSAAYPIPGQLLYPAALNPGSAGTNYFLNNGLSCLSDVDGNKIEWEIQAWGGSVTAGSILFRRGVLPDVRLCFKTGTPSIDGVPNDSSTRINVNEWSFPWSGALTWPAP